MDGDRFTDLPLFAIEIAENHVDFEGIGIQAGRSAQLFDGEVDLSSSEKSSSPRRFYDRLLTMGEGLRVQQNESLSRIPAIWRSPRESVWATESQHSSGSVVASVTDNLTTVARPKFYAVVPQGFREDAKVFVDRRHEWNGLDESGLPAELV